jgi:hypothetical protein
MNKSALRTAPPAAEPVSRTQGVLQRKCTCGNHTVSGGLCEDCGKQHNVLRRATLGQSVPDTALPLTPAPLIQTKLTIGAADDPLEAEADRVAEHVLAVPSHSCVNGTPPRIQRVSGQSARQVEAVPASVDRVLAGPGRSLDPALRQDMEQRFGHDFSKVRVHSGAFAEQSAREVSANAYTVGHNIVFGAGRFAPETHAGRRLLAHELTHILQQNAPTGDGAPGEGPPLMRQVAYPGADIPVPPLDYKRIADQIHQAIAGPGTDEEAVYRALQKLDRDRAAIDELKRVYLQNYKMTLLDDIYDDFSDEELEYALQLLNMGSPGSKQRVEEIPRNSIDVTLSARRIRESVEKMGTDEEAIFAVLLPFRQNTLELQEEYQRLYHEDLRDRLVDEMSGSELAYALELLETPYERYLQEGNEKLASAPFGSFGDLSNYCFLEDRQTSAGTKLIYWYDKEYWESGVDTVHRTCQVKLLPGKSAAAAIDAMFDHQDRWKIACAEFVQIVHLYALRHTLGAKRFDERVGRGGFTLEVKRRESTGIDAVVTLSRQHPTQQMKRSDTGQPDPRSLEDILAAAPIGSRVRWTNLSGFREGKVNAWEHENTIKLGPDKFGAHGTATGIFSTSNTHTREEIELFTARGTNPKASASYVKNNIFISEIEIFRDPSRRVVTR